MNHSLYCYSPRCKAKNVGEPREVQVELVSEPLTRSFKVVCADCGVFLKWIRPHEVENPGLLGDHEIAYKKQAEAYYLMRQAKKSTRYFTPKGLE